MGIRYGKRGRMFTKAFLVAVAIVLLSPATSSLAVPKDMLAYYRVYKVVSNYVVDENQAAALSNYALDVSNRLLHGNYEQFVCILKTESHFKNHKVGDGGYALGMGQMHGRAMVESCQYLGLKPWSCKVDKLRREVKANTQFAIELSAGYLAFLLNKFGGDWMQAIAAYNVGESNVRKGQWNFEYIDKVSMCVLGMRGYDVGGAENE